MAVALAADDLDRYASVPEAAARLGVHEKTARRWILKGTFPVPVHLVGGVQRVSLRRLVEHINGDAS